jgi:hypothetical protein
MRIVLFLINDAYRHRAPLLKKLPLEKATFLKCMQKNSLSVAYRESSPRVKVSEKLKHVDLLLDEKTLGEIHGIIPEKSSL